MPDKNRLILFRGPLGIKCAPHVNSELEIIVVSCGSIDVTVGDTIISVQEGEAVLILPYEMHAFSPKDGARARVYMFHPSLSDELFNKRLCRESSVSHHAFRTISVTQRRTRKNRPMQCPQRVCFSLSSENILPVAAPSSATIQKKLRCAL